MRDNILANDSLRAPTSTQTNRGGSIVVQEIGMIRASVVSLLNAKLTFPTPVLAFHDADAVLELRSHCCPQRYRRDRLCMKRVERVPRSTIKVEAVFPNMEE